MASGGGDLDVGKAVGRTSARPFFFASKIRTRQEGFGQDKTFDLLRFTLAVFFIGGEVGAGRCAESGLVRMSIRFEEFRLGGRTGVVVVVASDAHLESVLTVALEAWWERGRSESFDNNVGSSKADSKLSSLLSSWPMATVALTEGDWSGDCGNGVLSGASFDLEEARTSGRPEGLMVQ